MAKSMRTKSVAAGILALLPCAAFADLASDIAGRTLVQGKSRIEMNADGTMTGMIGKTGKEALSGTWSVRKGKLCRTITAPERLAGSECQTAVLQGSKLTITRGDGSTVEWTVK
jgi:hypothetical protein